MGVVGGLVCCYIVAILVGKKTKKMHVSTYIIVFLIACLQVAVVVYRLLTLPNPLSN